MAYYRELGAREVVRVLLPAALPFVVFDGHPPRKPAIATTATTTSALLRVDFGFATRGACGHECVWASSLDDLGLGSRARSSSGMGLRTAMLDFNLRALGLRRISRSRGTGV